MGLEAILNLGIKLIDKVFPDPKQKQEATLKLMELQQSGDLKVIEGQIEINKIEASSPKVFIAGWRPAVGWVSVAGLAMVYLVNPLVEWGTKLAGNPIAGPEVDLGTLITLLAGMLGLGGLRTVEKLNGAEGKR